MLALSAILALLCATSGIAEVVNKEVVRVIDGSGSFVKTSIDIKAEGVQGEYILLFPNAQAEALAFLTVTMGGKDLVIAPPVMYVM
jgi:hypothetical protein